MRSARVRLGGRLSRGCACGSLSHNGKRAASRRDVAISLPLTSAICTVMGPPASLAEPVETWAASDTRRMLHPVMVVKDIKAAQQFYADVLGMKALRYRSFPDGSANGFSGYQAEDKGVAFELVQKAGDEPIDIGSGFRHFSVAVPSIEGALQRAMNDGYEIVEGVDFEAGEVYIRDPSGYLWEILPAMGEAESVREINVVVSDLAASVKFYTEALGMTVMRTESTQGATGYKRASVAWGSKGADTEMVMTQPNTPEAAPKLLVEPGTNSYKQLAVATQDVYKATEAVRALGGAVVREPGPVPGIGTKVSKVADPDGWVVALVDVEDFLKELQ